jgi:hypothetical protein
VQQGGGKLRRTQQRECSGRAVTGRTGTAPLLPLCYLLTSRSPLMSTAAAATRARSRSVCGGRAWCLPSSPRLKLEGWTEARRSPTSLPLPPSSPPLRERFHCHSALLLLFPSGSLGLWADAAHGDSINAHFVKPIWFVVSEEWTSGAFTTGCPAPPPPLSPHCAADQRWMRWRRAVWRMRG